MIQHAYKDRISDELVRFGSALVVMPYGSGKTSLVIKQVTRPHAGGLRAVIFCGKRNILTWQNEFAKHAPEVDVITHPKCVDNNAVCYCGIPMDEHSQMTGCSAPTSMDTPTVLLINHRKVVTMLKDLEQLNPAFVVWDETTVIKNPKAQVTNSAISLRDTYDQRRIPCIGLTGNPIPEKELEIWSQFRFVYGVNSPFGSSYYAWCRHNFLLDGHIWTVKDERREQLYATMRQHTLRLTADEIAAFKQAVGIENRQYIMECFEETTEQRALLTQLDESWSLPAGDEGDGDIEYNHTMAILMKRQQIASGFYYIQDGNHRVAKFLSGNPKGNLLTSLLADLLDAGHRRIVVWYVFGAEVELIKRSWFAHDNIPERSTLLTFTDLGRSCFVDTVHHPHPAIMCVPVAAARGLNDLATASVDVFYSNKYNQELRDQAEARIDRLGQTSETITHIDLCSPTLWDTEIVTALQAKCLTEDRLNTIINKRKPQRKESA